MIDHEFTHDYSLDNEALEELRSIADQEKERQSQFKNRVFVCSGTACHSCGSTDVLNQLKQEAQKLGLSESCEILPGGCPGNCAQAPLVSVQPQNVSYQFVKPDDAPSILEALDSKPVERIYCASQEEFFQRQTRLVTEHRGLLNPQRIEEYIAVNGFEGLLKTVTESTPEQTVQEIRKSGLRGRGGAGYPTGLKWSTVAKSPTKSHKYVICNADEGDPGAYMNRTVMEAYPFAVLEGMLIGAFAVGADHGYVYVRAEYMLAVERMEAAIRECKKHGLIGSNIGGSKFNCDIEVRLGAGAFVCGEETALIASIEGGRGLPRPRPPYPAECGLWGCPTLINNVETFAIVPQIMAKGADWYAAYGTQKSKGTKTFALSGRVNRTGLVEVPLGTTLREIIFDIGGGVPEGHSFKAVQTGGPAGGCIPFSLIDTPVDYESLQSLGSFMGSGGIIVMDDTSCMVDVAKFFMDFCANESCGKCIPCRVGTVHMHKILQRITGGEATLEDLDMLESLCDVVRETSLCGLGQGAPNPVLSTLKFFRGEYLAHIMNHTCPAGVCGPIGQDLRRPQCAL